MEKDRMRRENKTDIVRGKQEKRKGITQEKALFGCVLLLFMCIVK